MIVTINRWGVFNGNVRFEVPVGEESGLKKMYDSTSCIVCSYVHRFRSNMQKPLVYARIPKNARFGCFEKFQKSTHTFAKVSNFSKICMVFSTGLWGPPKGEISKSAFEMQMTTLQWASFGKKDLNSFYGWDRAALEKKEIFLPLFLLNSTQAQTLDRF